MKISPPINYFEYLNWWNSENRNTENRDIFHANRFTLKGEIINAIQTSCFTLLMTIQIVEEYALYENVVSVYLLRVTCPKFKYSS